MKTATGNKAGFIRRLTALGLTLEDAKPYILADDGERLTLDIDHPDYPHKSKLPELLRQRAATDKRNKKPGECGGCKRNRKV